VASLAVVCLAPLLSGAVGRLAKGRPVYNGEEFETVLCAGQRATEGLTRYPPADAFGCPGLPTDSSYVYLPWLGDAVAAVGRAVGQASLLTAYQALFLLGLAFTVWLVAFRPMPEARVVERLPFLGALTGSVLQWGNVAGPAYAVLGAGALIAGAHPLGSVLLVAGAGAIKQVWLTLLLVCLVRPVGALSRWGWFGLGTLLGLAPTVLFLATGGAEAQAWRELLSYFAFVDRPGQGFLGFASLFSGTGSDPAVMAAWVLWAGLMVLATVALCERAELSLAGRVWLAVAVAVLLNPRLLAYEFLLLAPGLAVLVRAGIARGSRWVEPLVYGGAAACLVMNLGDLGDYAMMPLVAAASASVLALGLPHGLAGVRALLWFRVGG
jgi:hypothetical protein